MKNSIFLLPPKARPYRIHWDITHSCNFLCNHCASDAVCSGTIDDLSAKEIYKIVNNLRSERPFDITFFGGEPLIRDDIIDLIDLVKAQLDTCGISIVTNGSLLKQFGLDLLQRGVNISVSLDGTSANENDPIRGAGTFREIVENITWLINEKYSHSIITGNVNISFTLSSLFNSPEKLIIFAENIGINGISIGSIMELGRALQNAWLVPSDKQLIKFIEDMIIASKETEVEIRMNLYKPLFTKYINYKYGLNLPYKYYGCGIVNSDFAIRPNGSVVLCQGAYPGTRICTELNIPILNLVEYHIEEILGHDAFKKIDELRNPGRYHAYIPCNECEFAGSYCDPCWINAFFSEKTQHSLCLYAKEQLEVLTNAR